MISSRSLLRQLRPLSVLHKMPKGSLHSLTYAFSMPLKKSDRRSPTANFSTEKITPQETFDTQDTTFSNPVHDILEEALQHVATDGWTTEALGNAAVTLGYPAVAHGMFPRGAIELVEYFMDDSTNKMSEKLASMSSEFELMSVEERLKFAVKCRLEFIGPYMQTWHQAMAIGALPQNAPTIMRKLAMMSDEMWYYAGDRSTDMSWYTKRAILTGIYASTEVFMLTDKSEGFQDTWGFLDRRFEEALSLGDIPVNVHQAAGMVGIGIQSLLSAATSLAGPVASHAIRQTPLHGVADTIISASTAMSSNLPFQAPTPPKDITQDIADLNEEMHKFGAYDPADIQADKKD